MSRLSIMIVCLVCLPVQTLFAEPAQRSTDRPNILLIITDQQSATMLSCAGNRWLKTPAMDSLMHRGMRFEKAYATNPVCMPSRFSLFTGHYPSAIRLRENGRRHDSPDRFIPLAMGHTFQHAGYRTVYGGKVHLPGKMNDITTCGFELLTKNQRDELAKKCVAFLTGKHTRPFLLVASFINPHDICYEALLAPTRSDHPLRTSVEARTMRAAERMPSGMTEQQFFATRCPTLPDNFEPTRGEPQAINLGLKERYFRPWVRQHWDEKQWRRHRWTYCRLTERVDRQIGQVLQALRTAGLEDNTIVVFTSDHGDMNGAHRMEHKSMTYEEAARIPLMIQYPGVTRPGLVDSQHLVSNGLDLYPTLCDLAGVKTPDGLPGRSLKPLLAGESPATWRKYLMIETQFSHGVTDGRYKYTLFDVSGPEELLCDLKTDPGEMENLTSSRQHVQVLRRMRRALADQVAAYHVQLKNPVPGQ